MTSILYYSNFCEPSKKIIQYVNKNNLTRDIHFICIDNRIKDKSGKIFIILQNGEKIIMPDSITQVPALLLISQNYKVVFGNDIYQYLKPQQQQQIKEATNNNMEPMHFLDGFTLGGNSGIVSDNYSFLDQDLEVKGNGGIRQMHSYMLYTDSEQSFINAPPIEDKGGKSNKLKEGEVTIENLEQKRNQDLQNINYRTT